MLTAGEPFPAFELTADDGSVVSSSSLAGRSYLAYFYPRAGTPGCTREACSFRDVWAELEAAGLRVLGISFDSPQRNHAFSKRYQLPFPLLSDADRSLASQVGARMPLLPVPRRISYLVGPGGEVVEAYAEVHPAGHAEQVLDDFRRHGLAEA